jgi:hypothetical protein
LQPLITQKAAIAMKKYSLFILSVITLALGACSSDSDDDTTPKVPSKNQQYPVNLNVNIQSGEVDGGLLFGDISKVVSEPRVETDRLGYKGLILYCDDNRDITVFDLACPNCWNGNILTKVSNPTNDYECNVCGLEADVEYERGYLKDENGKIKSSMDLVKYKVTKIDVFRFDVTNPE